MWCTRCQQDVPAQPSPKSGELCCPRCLTEFQREPPGVRPAEEPTPVEASPPESPGKAFDSWEFDEQLRQIGRRLGGSRADGGQVKDHLKREILRLDPPHLTTPSWHVPDRPATKPPRRKPGRRLARKTTGGSLAWSALSVGTMVLVCGAILLVWAVASDRGELWAVGLPAAVIGQVLLLVGLVLQLDRLWRDSRAAAAKLSKVDVQLHELRATTTLMGTGGASPGSAFYSHLAGGAGPHLLLNDLKGQLDLLAMKISQES